MNKKARIHVLSAGVLSLLAALALTCVCGNGFNRIRSPLYRRKTSVRMSIWTIKEHGSQSIKSGIYGVAAAPGDALKSLAVEGNRWGGNTASRYNWDLGNVWNVGSDWFFRNQEIEKNAWHSFISSSLAYCEQVIITIPLLGYVAKDGTSYSYSVQKYGLQEECDPSLPDAGNGISANGGTSVHNNPLDASVVAGPEFMVSWIREMRHEFPEAMAAGRIILALGNEPMLWNKTHRDVHPEPVSYDSYLKRFIGMAKAVRGEAPGVLIAGPELWGWPAYFQSARDRESPGEPDREAHAGLDFIPWFLKKLSEYEEEHGIRLLDILSIHYYPQAVGVLQNEITQGAVLNRIHAPRSLYDQNYKAPSWIDDYIHLIPRMKQWVDRYYPGLEVAVTEYKWGAENHISGALALADTLGTFGVLGVHSACYWQYPEPDSLAAQVFAMYTNVNGRGLSFGDQSVPVIQTSDRSAQDSHIRVFAARSKRETGDDMFGVIIVNKDGRERPVELNLPTDSAPNLCESYCLTPGATSITQCNLSPVSSEGKLRFTATGQTIYHLRISLKNISRQKE